MDHGRIKSKIYLSVLVLSRVVRIIRRHDPVRGRLQLDLCTGGEDLESLYKVCNGLCS